MHFSKLERIVPQLILLYTELRATKSIEAKKKKKVTGNELLTKFKLKIPKAV